MHLKYYLTNQPIYHEINRSKVNLLFFQCQILKFQNTWQLLHLKHIEKEASSLSKCLKSGKVDIFAGFSDILIRTLATNYLMKKHRTIERWSVKTQARSLLGSPWSSETLAYFKRHWPHRIKILTEYFCLIDKVEYWNCMHWNCIKQAKLRYNCQYCAY